MTLLRAALHRITPRTALLALLSNAALLLLTWAWLYIPDSHVYQFLFAMLFAAGLLAGFLALYATLIRHLYADPQRTRRPLWQSSLILAGWLFLGHILQHLTGRLSTNLTARAGYWNSQLSPHNRAFFSFERLIHWQNLAIEFILWIVIPALLLPAAVETTPYPTSTSPNSWRIAWAVLARPQLWLTVALAYIGGSWIGNHLLDWHPGHTVHAELLSLALRSAFVYALAIALLLITLAVTAELLAHSRTQWLTRRNPTP